MGISTDRGGDGRSGLRAPSRFHHLNIECEPASVPLLADRGGVVASVRSASVAHGIDDAWTAVRAHLSLLAVLVLISVVVVLIDLVPASDYQSPTLRATAEAVTTLFAFGGAWLLRAQFGHTRRLRDLLLLWALLTLGVTSLFSRALPAALNLTGNEFTVAALWGQLFVAFAFAAAAFVPADRLIAGRHPVAVVAILSMADVIVAELAGLLLTGQFVAASAHSAHGTGGAAQRPLALVFVLWTTGLFIFAATMFAARNRIDDNGLGSLLTVAAILLAVASFSHIGVPLPAPGRVAVRFITFALLLVAAVRQELLVRKTLPQAAALAERRRVAQDLHDGLAQDLAFIAAHGARIAEQLGEEHPVAIAARRALATSRSAIAELSDPAAATAQEALEAIAYELRDRFEISIAVHVHLEDEVAADTREQMARIAREAIANAACHGGARNVVVSLKRTHRGVVLSVIDNGSGIGSTALTADSEGFGLRSMRERAVSLGGQLTVRQPRKRVTELEVVLP